MTPTAYPPVLLPTLEALYQLGSRVCTEIDTFQPDLIVGLAHSGWMPVQVAQILWDESHPCAPFPSALRTNIGQEKKNIYTARFGTHSPAYCCGECSEEISRIGHYLAWIADQTAWLDQLGAQIRTVREQPPARILVVDDLFGSYRTCYIAMGLLETVYPQAAVKMVAGKADLTEAFVSAWLGRYVPVLASDLPDPNLPEFRRKRYLTTWHETLKPLITGSEDIRPDSLEVRLIGADSECVKALAEHLPASDVLSTLAWPLETARAYARDRLHGTFPSDQVREPEDDRIFPVSDLAIAVDERAAMQAWLHNGLDRKTFGKGSRTKHRGYVIHLGEFWYRQGRGNSRRYFPDGASESWMTAFRPIHEIDFTHRLSPFAEFLSGRLWAGAYPAAADPTFQPPLFQAILATGVRHFIDLTHPGDDRKTRPYARDLEETAVEAGIPVETSVFPLYARAAPSVRQIDELIERIETSPQPVYLHGGHNMDSRVPFVLAYLLVNRGQTAAQALETVSAFWLETMRFLIRLPLSPGQRRLLHRLAG